MSEPLTDTVLCLIQVKEIVNTLPLTMGHGAVSRLAVLDIIDDAVRFAAASKAPTPPDALREFMDAWTPMHTGYCASQDDDAECVCGVGPEYERMLFFVRRIEDLEAEVRKWKAIATQYNTQGTTFGRGTRP